MLRRRVAAPSHNVFSSRVSVYVIASNSLSQSAISHYLYHPPGSREPSLPWYNPSNNMNKQQQQQQQQVNPTTSSLNVTSAPVYNPFASDNAAYQVNTPIPPSSSSSSSSSSSFQTAELEELLRTSSITSHSSSSLASSSAAAAAIRNENVKVASTPVVPSHTTTTTATSSSQTVNKENSKSIHAHTSSGSTKSNTQHDHKQPSSSSSATSSSSVEGVSSNINNNTISLDTRIENIIKVEDNHISSEMLPKVVQLLIDPNAEKVENITLSEFASMQPRRQLMALNMQKSWHDWILNSSYYQQAARLAAESPAQDLKALQHAGIYTLQQWMEQPNLVNVSLRTRSALDSAIEESIQLHMNEMATVVNTSLLLESQWNAWMSDVIGKFVLDALRITLPSASAALHARRQQYYTSVQRQQSKMQETSNSSNKNENNSNLFNAQEANNSAAMLSAMMDNNNNNNSKEKTKFTNSGSLEEENSLNNVHGTNSSPLLSLPAMYYDGPVLRPGEACTLEHYYRFVQKVLAGVRQDYLAANNNNNNNKNDMEEDEETNDFINRGDLQSETEILERTYAIIATAMNQLLEQAAQLHLPHELRGLYNSGYVALDRVPGVLKRAMSHLQLRLLPVRHFVFHSTLDSAEFTRTNYRSHARYASSAKQANQNNISSNNKFVNRSNTTRASSSDSLHSSITSNSGSSSSSSSLSSPLDISAPVYASGTFLTGSSLPDVTLGEWCGTPIPPSSNENTTRDDPAQKEYFSLLHRLRRHVDKLSMTTMNELLSHSEEYGGNGFSACDALGLHQLFGPAKLVEDRLASVLAFPLSSIEKPIHFIEAGYTSGKTALLERLQNRTKLHERAVLVRYNSSATPFIPDVDDHPLSFASRFWFRVALSCCPYWIRTELLFSRAPQSVMWWAHSKNWNWERFQSLLINGDKAANRSIITNNNCRGYHLHGSARGNWRKLLQSKPLMYDVQNQLIQLNNNINSVAILDQVAQLTAILVDDMDRVLDSMESKWAVISETAMLQQSALAAADAEAAHEQEEDEEEEQEEEEELSKNIQEAGDREESEDVNSEENLEVGEDKMLHGKSNKSKKDNKNEDSSSSKKIKHMVNSNGVLTLNLNSKASPPVSLVNETHEQHQKRLQSLQQWSSATGKPLHEALQNTFTPLLTALGQLEMIFTGHRVSTHFVNLSHVPVRRYFIPVIGNGAGLQQRLRVLPLMSCLHALHLRAHLEFPGLLYEVLKNSPALAGKTLEVFWTNRISLMDLRTGNTRLLQWDSSSKSNSASQLLLQSYLPHELYAELPLRNYLLQYPRWARLRLVELLQRQLSSPTGYLTTGIDTNSVDERVGLISPHNHTCAQVHPFALFTIFSHQEVLEGSSSSNSSSNNNHLIGTSSSSSNNNNGVLYHPSNPREKKVVRAWAEVWAEYKSVVAGLATTPSRKRDALRVLLHGALLLRSAAVAGAQLDLNLKVPPFGFPLLSSEVRVKSKHTSSSSSHHYYYQQPNYISPNGSSSNNGLEVRSASVETVRKAISAYKSFFVNATQSHFPFRPVVGLNGGCDVVFISGSTLALYDLVTTSAELKEMTYRFAEALLGVLHILERQVLPIDKIRSIQYTTVVSIDQMKPTNNNTSSLSISHSTIMSNEAHSFSSTSHNNTGSSNNNKIFSPLMDVFTANSSPVIPHLLDYSAVFEDSVMDRLDAVKEPLGISQVFRTLSELIDELEQRHHVKVQQDVISAQEEMESLLSPTLFQLVPDATVLPPYTSTVISAEDLMMEAMLSREDDDDVDEGDDVNDVVDGENNHSEIRAKLQNMNEEADDINNVRIEEDMNTNGKSSSPSTHRLTTTSSNITNNNNKDDNHLVLQRSTSAEAEDAMSDVFYAREVEGAVAATRSTSPKSQQEQQQQLLRTNNNNSPLMNNTTTTTTRNSLNVLSMDNDMAPESAALLEAMMNDRIDELTDARRKNAMAQAQMQEELRRDMMTENAINYNTPFSLTTNSNNNSNKMNVKVDGVVHSPLSTSQGVINTNSLMNNNNTNNNNANMLRRNADLETDSLAWLHDIISPEALMGTSAEMPVSALPQQQQQQQQETASQLSNSANKNENIEGVSVDENEELNENNNEEVEDDEEDDGDDNEAAAADDEESDEALEEEENEEEEEEEEEGELNENVDDNTENNTEIPTLEGLEDASTIFPRTVAKRGRRGLSSLTKKANATRRTNKSATERQTNSNKESTTAKNRKTRMTRKQAARGLRASQGTAANLSSSSSSSTSAGARKGNSSTNASENSAKRLLASLAAGAKSKAGRGVSAAGSRGHPTKGKKPATSNKSNTSSSNAAKGKKTTAAAALNKRRASKK